MKKSLIASCVFALLAAGCGKETSVSTPAGQATVTQKGNVTNIEMKSSKGEKVSVAASDKGVALPENFPNDIPVMPGAVVKMAVNTGGNLSVHFSVKASPADAMKFYEENLKAKGWKIDATMNMGESSMVSAEKDKRKCVLNIAKEDGGGVMVQVMVPNEKG